MKLSHTLLAALVGGLVALGAAQMLGPKTPETSHKETAFERVMRTNTLRCGYVVWAPFLVMDPATKEKSGIAYDVVSALGKELNLKVEWVEEVGWGNFHEGLNAGRYDAMCVPVWESGARARMALLTRPIYDTGLYIYARENEHRFDSGFEAIDNPQVRVAVIDGDITQAIRHTRFPKAQELALPAMADAGQFLLSVVTGKADVSLDNPFEVARYNQNASVKLKAVAGGKPAQMFGNSLAVKFGESDFKAALDATVGALLKNGTLDRIVKKYDGFSPTTLR